MTIQIANRQKHAAIDRKALRALCTRLLRRRGRDADLSLAYVGDAEIRDLNERFLDHKGATDVLAFPMDDSPGPDRLLGEIVVSAETAVAEAARRGIPADAELALYTVHGLLHLLGYDDQAPADRRRMRRAERAALAEE